MAKRTREMLRRYARSALEQQGFDVEPVTGPGIVPGARLKAARGKVVKTIAVRTSRDRKVGLLRHPNGKWRTIPKVDEVVVAVQALDDPMSVEVLGFSPKALIDAFDAFVAKIEKGRRRQDASKSPVFIALDILPGDRGEDLQSGLKARSEWSVTLPRSSEMTDSRYAKSKSGFVERVRKEFAELNGVDVSKVIVSFHIVG